MEAQTQPDVRHGHRRIWHTFVAVNAHGIIHSGSGDMFQEALDNCQMSRSRQDRKLEPHEITKYYVTVFREGQNPVVVDRTHLIHAQQENANGSETSTQDPVQ